MSKQRQKSSGNSAGSRISDSRFANFETDRRYRLPSKHNTKTTIDKRFSRMLNDEEFTTTAKVDRYGRKIGTEAKKKALANLYREEEDEEDDDDEDAKSGEEESGEDSEDDGSDDDKNADRKYDPARQGGFSSSESDSDSDLDEEEAEEIELDASASMQRFADEQTEVEEGEVTNRVAVVNLDWDNIKSVDLMALFSSFLPPKSKGSIEKVSIYPSEFGKERMEREELEGPPKEIFQTSNKEVESDESESEDDEETDEKIKKELLAEGDADEFDNDALRAYQLDRLRYFYAVVICSDKATAQEIYEATDGTEYLSSSNFLDLRFVPDDVPFDDEPRDECTAVPEGYEPVEFVTDALQSSKVSLTWDLHPEEVSRKESIKKAFGASRDEMEQNDLRAYLASDTEDEDVNEDAEGNDDEDGDRPLTKKELARKKMREALGLGDEPLSKPKSSGPVGDMQVTFTPALTETKKTKQSEGIEETTIEKYKRQERERKEKKRQLARARREGDEGDEETVDDAKSAQPEEDLGFDDPFFTVDEPEKTSKTSIRKEERRKKREAREAEEAAKSAEKAHLKKVMSTNNNQDSEPDINHFDMKAIMRAEKQKNKKHQKKSKKSKQPTDETNAAALGLQPDFEMNVADSRFSAVFDSHEFAIDPSNPRFQNTESMRKLLDEGRRKRKDRTDGDEPDGEERSKGLKEKSGKRDGDVGELIASVKRKAKKVRV